MPSKHDAVLVVGGGILQRYLIAEAHALGLAVIATDGNPHAPGLADADMAFVCDTYDQEATAALLPLMQQKYTVRGAVTAGADVAHTVALCAERLGTPGIPYDVALRTHDKWDVRHTLCDAHLERYQPTWYICDTELEASRSSMEDIVRLHGMPYVVKPREERASRGVTIVQTPEMLQTALTKAGMHSRCVLVEQCLTGTEHSAELIMDATGAVYWFNIVDRLFDYSTNVPIELGHVNPTNLDEQTQDTIYDMVLAAAKALSVTQGPFKCDVMLTDDGPKILECTARLSGGFDCQRTSPLTGRHPMRTLLQWSCVFHMELPPSPQGYAACAAMLPTHTGTLQAWPDWSNITHPANKACLWMEEAILIAKPGDMIAPLEHNAQRPGFVLAYDMTYEGAWRNARNAAAAIAAHMEMA